MSTYWPWVTAAAAFILITILGVIVEDIWGSARIKAALLGRNWQVHRTDRRYDAESLATHIAGKYRQRGIVDTLFVPKTVDDSAIFPMMSDLKSTAPIDISPEQNTFIEVALPQRDDSFTIDKSFVRRMLKSGRKLSNSSVLFVDRIDDDPDRGRIVRAGVAGYQSVMTLAERVTRSINRERKSSIPFKYLRNFDSFCEGITTSIRPVIVGGDSAVVFNGARQPMIAVVRRSSKTMNAPGAYTVVPAYTMEPNYANGRTSRFGLETYNFLREFMEEFWGDEHLAEAGEKPRANPDWIFDSDHGKRLLAEVDGQRFKLHRVGLSIDVSSCCLSVSTVAIFDSSEFFEYVMSSPGSWENAPAGYDRPAIEYVHLFGTEVDEMLRGTAKPTTAVAIDGARRLMRGGQNAV